jgi:FOG: Ankyrin repeat
MAIYHRDQPTVRRLLDAGVDVNQTDADGFAPVHIAASWGNEEALALLLARGANPNLPGGDEDMTPLACAASDGNTGIARLLLKHGADVNGLSRCETTPVRWAADGLHHDMVRLLAAHGADLNRPDDSGLTPLMNLCGGYDLPEDERLAMVRLLLDSGADVNCRTPCGTALHNAVAWGQRAIVRELLRRGADVRLVNDDGETPADHVRPDDPPEIAEMLQKAAGAAVRRR